MIFDNVIKFIFPSRCIICDKILPYGDKLENLYLCDDCKKHFEFIKEPCCKKCGAMIESSDELYCIRCKEHLHKNFDYGFGLLRYNSYVKNSLHKIKYNGRKEYIYFYGKCIVKKYHDLIKEINPDYIIPVPIHKNRLRVRNYNQASVLAKSIEDELKTYDINIPYRDDLIFRIKNTKVLNKLSDSDRSNELLNAFKTSDLSNINKVIIVDDIYTTGSTIDSIAYVLKKAGVKEVYFIAIAIVDNL